MTVRIDVHLAPADLDAALRRDVLAGLTSRPKSLPPKWFYDDRGSQLFDAITRLPEYYPTRAERSILEARSRDIARAASCNTLVELGSGTSEKTRLLLDALHDEGALVRFVPFDVSEQTLRDATADCAAEYATIDVRGVVGDFEHHLDRIPHEGRRLIAFLGGTIGNFAPIERAEFLAKLVATMDPGDALLLGTDLVKDPARLVLAYDDAAGVTAEFNRNVLHVLNRTLDADFQPERFAHVAVWDAEHEWIEMRLRAVAPMSVKVHALDLVIDFDEGEEMRTEISAKFRREGVESELAAVGVELTEWWTDSAGDFALSLSHR